MRAGLTTFTEKMMRNRARDVLIVIFACSLLYALFNSLLSRWEPWVIVCLVVSLAGIAASPPYYSIANADNSGRSAGSTTVRSGSRDRASNH